MNKLKLLIIILLIVSCKNNITDHSYEIKLIATEKYWLKFSIKQTERKEQVISFYKNKNLIKQVSLNKNIFHKYDSSLICEIVKIGIVCDSLDTLYYFYGGGEAKNLEFLAFYSLDGILKYCSLSDWDTVYCIYNLLPRYYNITNACKSKEVMF